MSTDAAGAIVRMLERVSVRADLESLAHAEQTLVEQAAGLTLDQLSKLIVRAEAFLDPDGVEPREQEAHDARALRTFERDGRIHFSGSAGPAQGAAIVTAIQAIVSAQFRAGASSDVLGEDQRSLPQRQLDALALIAEHFLGCEHKDTPIGGATVIVRMTLDDLQNDTGHATIDGIDQPISVGTARRMAAAGNIIPAVLGTDSEILDWGRTKRLFTPPQRFAVGERDGGCAGCGAPPGMTKVHHLEWWHRDHGCTDLCNGVLLCEACHHRVHDNGWEIRVEGSGVNARIWFIPPAHIDPDRAPRLGGRHRYDYRPAA